MKEILSIDYKNVINSNKFKLMTLIIFIIPTIAFIMSCKFYYSLPINFVRSSLEENFIGGMVSRHIKMWFILILPILSMMICSDIYINQYNNGVYKSILTRTSKFNYIISKVIVVLTLTFLVIFFSLLFNQILFCIAFPLDGIDNARALPSFDIGYLNYSESRFLDIIRLKNRLLYNIIYFTIFGLVSSLYALVSLGISFFIKNAKISIILTFAVFFGIYIIFMTLGIQDYHINYYLDGDSKGNIFFIIWVGILSLEACILTYIKYKFSDEI